MTYNFDEIIDRRNTNSENVEGWRPYIFHCGPERVFPYKDEEFIRMWVADMEFAVAPEILQAITDRCIGAFWAIPWCTTRGTMRCCALGARAATAGPSPRSS